MKKLTTLGILLLGSGMAAAMPLQIAGKPGFAIPQGSTFKDNYDSQFQLAVAIEGATESWVKPIMELGYNAGHDPEDITTAGVKTQKDGGELSITYLTPGVKLVKETQVGSWKVEPFALGGLGLFQGHTSSFKTKTNGVETGTTASDSNGGWAVNLGVGVGVKPTTQFTVAFDLRYQVFADKLALTKVSDGTTKRENPVFLTPGVLLSYKF
ncbi:MAG: outer membrane beta-barrel protein [Elusimicrobia bacterium]|nr:outer membrane beta-barrel protein [Elusimicrobiota bacterium]